MLVLSRKVGERVVIEGGISLQVLEVNDQRIRLGFEAPPEIGIWRGELATFKEPTQAAAAPELQGDRHDRANLSGISQPLADPPG